jgi:hypothetical protein
MALGERIGSNPWVTRPRGQRILLRRIIETSNWRADRHRRRNWACSAWRAGLCCGAPASAAAQRCAAPRAKGRPRAGQALDSLAAHHSNTSTVRLLQHG